MWYNPSVRREIHRKHLIALLIALAIFTAGAGFAYRYSELQAEHSLFVERARLLEQSVELASGRVRQLEKDNSDLTDANENLSQTLEAEQAKNSTFESQIRDITGMVGTLTKLSQTDRELLKKYSKVYFLSENYAPATLSLIPPTFLATPEKLESIHTSVEPFLTRMLSDARTAGTPLAVVSAYRSFYEQESVKTGYKVLYGSGANRFSADQGYSEHQLGTTVDLTTPEITGLSLRFEDAPAYAWLTGNAFRFGFVLSYPKHNEYYQFEPWHWRFVGVTLATKLRNENKYFYDLPQREIDTYLISFFDP